MNLAVSLTEEDLERIASAVARKLSDQAQAAGKTKHLTVREACARLRCSDRTLRRQIALGRLRKIQLGNGVGGKVLIDAESVEAFLAGKR